VRWGLEGRKRNDAKAARNERLSATETSASKPPIR
jgi:hypothetical protein